MSTATLARVTLATAMIGCLLAAETARAALVSPTGVTTADVTDFFTPANMINGSGLSNASLSATHATSDGGNSWVSTNPYGGDYYTGGINPVLTFDLGATYDVANLLLWNYTVAGNGTRLATVEFSTTGTGGTFSDAVDVYVRANASGGQPGQLVSLGGTHTANAVRLTLTDNHDPATGGDRVGLNEFKLVEAATSSVISIGAEYAYSSAPGFNGGADGSHRYEDQAHSTDAGVAANNFAGVGVYGAGDLTNGIRYDGGGNVTDVPNDLVGIHNSNNTPRAVDITMDLGSMSLIDHISVGSYVYTPFANGAPDDVTISFSRNGSTFTDAFIATFTANESGSYTFEVPLATVFGRYVKFSFNGGSVASISTNKYFLDELTVYGVANVPAPAAMPAGLALLGFVALRRRRQ